MIEIHWITLTTGHVASALLTFAMCWWRMHRSKALPQARENDLGHRHAAPIYDIRRQVDVNPEGAPEGPTKVLLTAFVIGADVVLERVRCEASVVTMDGLLLHQETFHNGRLMPFELVECQPLDLLVSMASRDLQYRYPGIGDYHTLEPGGCLYVELSLITENAPYRWRSCRIRQPASSVETLIIEEVDAGPQV